MQFNRIVLLAGKWETTPLVYNFLNEEWKVDAVILEEGVPRKEFLKKRIKKLGLIAVGGQVMFQMLIGKPLGKLSKKRIAEIKKLYELKDTPISPSDIKAVSSVNSNETLDVLQELKPDLVIVHGTRIISKK